MKALIWLGMFLLLITSVFGSCKCLPADAGVFYNMSDIIFAGTVTNINYGFEDLFDATNKIDVDMIHSFKGSFSQRITIETPATTAQCGISFKEKERYLIYAYEYGENQTLTDLCVGTKFLNESIDEIRYLNEFTDQPRHFFNFKDQKKEQNFFQKILSWFGSLF